MKLARTIRLDESDLNIFETPAELDEWAISGGFAFADWTEAELTGKQRQAFANGWLGLESFGRSTFVVVTTISQQEYDKLVEDLAQHFVDRYGAPDAEAARPVAEAELADMRELCEAQTDNVFLAVSRELVGDGVRESYRAIEPQLADLSQFAVHG